MTTESNLEDLGTRIDELAAECRRLRRENGELRTRIDALTRPAAPDVRPDSTLSRRRLIGGALGAAAAGAAGVTFLEPASPAAAANGDPVAAGATTTAETSTTVRYDGAANFHGLVLFGNDSPFNPSTTLYPAALGGWAGAGATGGGVPHGVYGFTDNGAGHGVIGYCRGVPDSGGAGVFGRSASGAAVRGECESAADNARAVHGVITSTAPGTLSAAVRGENLGTADKGVGVHGSQAGAGWGVYGQSPTGVGVRGASMTGIGVSALSRRTALRAHTTGTNALAVDASSKSAQATLSAVNTGPGRGASFAGRAAAVRLNPGARSTHPASGLRGDLYVDKSGRLWYCRTSGSHAKWKQLA